MKQAGGQILEPVMSLEVTVGEGHLGAVLGDLAQRRGVIKDIQILNPHFIDITLVVGALHSGVYGGLQLHGHLHLPSLVGGGPPPGPGVPRGGASVRGPTARLTVTTCLRSPTVRSSVSGGQPEVTEQH
ncbi:hypothetical protein CRUP_000025 [Coryphaenoides rupestris]|nr:hypothetical protein CRUP_000025 [Coryphaenoides rupestris]